jgi:predicted secreted protein
MRDLDWSDVEADALNDPNRVETTYNYMDRREVAMEDATMELANGRWYIRMGFAGYNSLTNNGDGYSTKARAEAAIRHYCSKTN